MKNMLFKHVRFCMLSVLFVSFVGVQVFALKDANVPAPVAEAQPATAKQQAAPSISQLPVELQQQILVLMQTQMEDQARAKMIAQLQQTLKGAINKVSLPQDVIKAGLLTPNKVDKWLMKEALSWFKTVVIIVALVYVVCAVGPSILNGAIFNAFKGINEMGSSAIAAVATYFKSFTPSVDCKGFLSAAAEKCNEKILKVTSDRDFAFNYIKETFASYCNPGVTMSAVCERLGAFNQTLSENSLQDDSHFASVKILFSSLASIFRGKKN